MTVLRVNAGALRPTLAGVLAYRDAGVLSLDHQGAQGQSLLEAWLQGGQAFLATTLSISVPTWRRSRRSTAPWRQPLARAIRLSLPMPGPSCARR